MSENEREGGEVISTNSSGGLCVRGVVVGHTYGCKRACTYSIVTIK